MSIAALVGIGVLTAVACLLLRPYNPTGSLVCGIVGGLVLLFGCLENLRDILAFANSLLEKGAGNTRWFGLLIKVLGICYLCKFGSDLCRDAGETAVAGAVEGAGKILIVALSVPYLMGMIETIADLIKL